MSQEYQTPVQTPTQIAGSPGGGTVAPDLITSDADLALSLQDQGGSGNSFAADLVAQGTQAPAAPVLGPMAQWAQDNHLVLTGIGWDATEAATGLYSYRDEALGRCMAELTPDQRADALRRAEEVYAALANGDEDTAALREALQGLDSQFMGQAVREAFNERYDVRFDEVLVDQLDQEELDEAGAWLSGDQVSGTRAAIHNDLDGDDDEVGIEQTLRDLVAEGGQAELMARFYAGDRATLEVYLEAHADLSGEDLAVFDALFLRGDLTEADAIRAYDAMDGGGTDTDALREILERVPEGERAHFQEEYASYVRATGDDDTSTNFVTELQDEESSYTRDEMIALARGDRPAALAARYLDALEGAGTEEADAIAVFQGLSREERIEVREALRTTYQLDDAALTALEMDEFENVHDLEAILQVRTTGEVDRVTQLQRATDGLGTDEEGVMSAMEGLTRSEVSALGNTYTERTGEYLSDIRDDELEGEDAFKYNEVLNYGSDHSELSIEDLGSLVENRHAWDREGRGSDVVGTLMTLFGSGQVAQQADLDVARFQNEVAAGHRSEEELRVLAEDALGTSEVFEGARDEAVTNGGQVLAAIMTLPAAVLSGPGATLITRFLAGMGTLVAPHAVESLALGDGYGEGQAISDLGIAAASALPAAAIGNAFRNVGKNAGFLGRLGVGFTSGSASSMGAGTVSGLLNDDVLRGDGDAGVLDMLVQQLEKAGISGIGNSLSNGLGGLFSQGSSVVSGLVGNVVEGGVNTVLPDLVAGEDVSLGFSDLASVGQVLGGMWAGYRGRNQREASEAKQRAQEDRWLAELEARGRAQEEDLQRQQRSQERNRQGDENSDASRQRLAEDRADMDARNQEMEAMMARTRARQARDVDWRGRRDDAEQALREARRALDASGVDPERASAARRAVEAQEDRLAALELERCDLNARSREEEQAAMEADEQAAQARARDRDAAEAERRRATEDTRGLRAGEAAVAAAQRSILLGCGDQERSTGMDAARETQRITSLSWIQRLLEDRRR